MTSRCSFTKSKPISIKSKNTSLENIEKILYSSSQIEAVLKKAALFAKNEIKENKVNRSPAIEIGGESNCSIVIDIVKRTGTDEELFLIYRHSESKLLPLYRVPVGKYRFVYIHDLVDCRIFVKCKLLKLMFQNCKKTQISIRTPIIGGIELFQCKHTNISIRIPSNNATSSMEGSIFNEGYDLKNKKIKEYDKNVTLPVPLIRLENCRELKIFQSNESLVYIIKCCIGVSGTIVDQDTGERLSRYDLGKLIWSEQQQNLICLSKNNGFASVSMKYALNDIGHHLHIKPPNKYDKYVSGSTPVFSKTPPTPR